MSMMESDTIQKMREKLLICAVCMDEFEDPRILQCHHTFCLKCIDDIILALPINSRFFSCPQCRQDAVIPRNGINKLPVNFYLVSLKDELGAAAQCGMCQICDLAHVQFHCEDCNFSICRFCIAPHRLEQHSARSKIERLPSPTASSHGMTSNSCEIHSGELLQLFCRTCQEAVCITCSCSRKHSWHRLIPLSEHLQEIQSAMQKELDEVIHEQHHACESMSSIEERKETLISSSNKSILDLNLVATKACKTIMKLKSEIENEIKTSTETQVAHMTDVENKLQAYVDMLNQGQDFLIDLHENDICMETVNSFKKFSASLKEKRNQFTSTTFQLQSKSFNISRGIRAIDISIGSPKTQLLYGNLGVLSSEHQNLYVNKTSLEVISKPRKAFGLLTNHAVFNIVLFIIAFLVSNDIISLVISYGDASNGLDSKIANVFYNIVKMAKEMTDIGMGLFEDFFMPP